jgi:hypothetical protein
LVYYLQRLLPPWPGILKDLLLCPLILVAFAAIVANYKWIVDYRRRLEGGIDHVMAATRPSFNVKEALTQMRWSNAKLLAVVTITLGVLSQLTKLKEVPQEHWVPILATLLVIFVALFDTALDLQAEWTIQGFGIIRAKAAAARDAGATVHPVHVASAMWHCNQVKPAHRQLYEAILNGTAPAGLPFTAFTVTVQNLISFAIIIVFLLAGAVLVLLWGQLVWPLW